jgi:hypothetical protein
MGIITQQSYVSRNRGVNAIDQALKNNSHITLVALDGFAPDDVASVYHVFRK